MKSLAGKLSQLIGKEIDITIRGENKFTFSFEGKDEIAASQLIDFFGNRIIVDEIIKGYYDEECDMTFIYASFKIEE